MKTKYLILTLALAALTVSCNKEQDQAVPQPEIHGTQKVGDFLFSSSTGEVTKVGLAADNSLYWTAGDQMSVYSYNGNDLVCQDMATLYSGEGSSTGRFAPVTYLDNANWYDPAAVSLDYDFYAWYPAAPVEDPAAKVISITNVHPSQFGANGIGSYIVCWAGAKTNKSALVAGTAPSFSFTPKSALLKLGVWNSSSLALTINSIRLEADANISGEADLNLGTGVLGAGNRSVITYTPASPILVGPGGKSQVPVYISVLPCAATNIAVTIKDGETSIPSVDVLPLSGIESGKVYSKIANVAFSGPKREVPIFNLTSQNASANVLEANKLYYGKANCLVMGPDETQGTLNIQLFESSDGFARSNLASSFETAVTSAKVIWAETALFNDANFGIIGANLNTLTISKSSGVTGNALVGIYDEADNLLWSYHIWCPADASTYTNFESQLGTVFPSVYKLALGQVAGETADAYMYYQWGRKDPLGRAASFSSGTTSLVDITGATFSTVAATSTNEESNNLAYARKNPTEFITEANNTVHDWYPAKSSMTTNANQENRLWSTTGATIYDPCPEGYHVAPKTLWEGSSTFKSSGNFSAGKTTKLWYVLGGNRSSWSGYVTDVATRGLYWSSEVVSSSVNAYELTFYSDYGENNVFRASSYGRVYGFGVRCVK